MPARNDIYTITKQLLLDAGATTVLRGYWWPGSETMPGGTFPIAAVFESRQENITNANLGFEIDGELGVQLWAESGTPGGILGADDSGWKVIDDLHDAFLRKFAGAFDQAYLSNTTQIYPTAFEPLYWYTESPHLCGVFRIFYRMGFA